MRLIKELIFLCLRKWTSSWYILFLHWELRCWLIFLRVGGKTTVLFNFMPNCCIFHYWITIKHPSWWYRCRYLNIYTQNAVSHVFGTHARIISYATHWQTRYKKYFWTALDCYRVLERVCTALFSHVRREWKYFKILGLKRVTRVIDSWLKYIWSI